MKISKFISAVIIFCIIIVANVYAEESPETLVKTVSEASQIQPAVQTSPEERWRTFLSDKGWDRGLSDGGVFYIPERELIICSATAFTKVRLGQPGWVESRVVAFENAEMEAKMKIIRYLAETVETERSLSMLEHAVWEDGEVNKVQELNDVAETLKRIGKKGMALAESKLDNALKKLDENYDPADYEGKSSKELQVIAEDLFNRKVKAVAMGTMIGTTPLYSTEGISGNNEYQVLVGVIWSPKLNRLAMSLFNDEYNIPPASSGKKLTEQIPADELALIGTVGTRIVIDENGDYSIIAYGQSQPRRSSPERQQAALEQAKQISANRARAQLVNFIREGMTLRDSEISQELSQEFSDMTFGTETVRDYQKSIIGKKVKVKLSGLRILKEWNFEHPATGQQVAGAVVAWSPSAAQLSKQAAGVMQAKPKASPKEKSVSDPAKVSGQSNLESMEVDTSAY